MDASPLGPINKGNITTGAARPAEVPTLHQGLQPGVQFLQGIGARGGSGCSATGCSRALRIQHRLPNLRLVQISPSYHPSRKAAQKHQTCGKGI